MFTFFAGIHPPNDKSTISAHLMTIIHLISSHFIYCGVFQDIAVDAFVPTATVVSTSQDLRWMVQPTVITSVSPSSARQKTKSHDATQTAASHKAKPSNRKGHKEKVCWTNTQNYEKVKVSPPEMLRPLQTDNPCLFEITKHNTFLHSRFFFIIPV